MKTYRTILTILFFVPSYPFMVIVYSIIGFVPLMGFMLALQSCVALIFNPTNKKHLDELKELVEMIYMPFVIPFMIWFDYLKTGEFNFD